MKSIRLVIFGLSLVWARFDQLQVAVAKDGYAVTRHEVQTSDGWKLQIIHLTKALLTDWSGRKIPITGLVEPPPEVKAMVDPFEPKLETIDEEVIFEDEPMDNLFQKLMEETNIVRRPVLLQTSSGMNADDWFKYVLKENNLPYKLLDLGFDVWIGNNRGVYDYSANISYRANQIDIYWNFDFTDMAERDLPAQIDYILEKVNEPRLTYIGYGRGNTQMFYGMAKDPGYFGSRIELFVALSPALYYSTLMNVYDYNYYFAGIDAAGIFVIGGPTWSQDRKRLCEKSLCLNAIYPCDFPLEVPACDEYPEKGLPGQPIVIKDFKHFQQNTINNAFNEYVSQWQDRQYAKLVPLDNIPRVPIHLIAANSDLIWADCSEELMRRVKSVQSLSQFEGYGRFHNSSDYFNTLEQILTGIPLLSSRLLPSLVVTLTLLLNFL